METMAALFGILGALLLGAISPGPSFVLVARTSIAVSRRDGLAAALGMGAGGVIFGGLALLGLRAVLAHVAWLYAGFRLIGGLYLLYLALRLWRGAVHPLAVPETVGRDTTRLGTSFALAFATQLSNPKTAVVYGSIFAAFLPAQLPLWAPAALLPLIFVVEAGWYTVVAFALSAGRPRTAYLRSKTWIDRTAGTIMGILGVRLLTEAGPPV